MDRLKRLVEARDLLAQAIKACESNRDLATLCREYRQTLNEIESSDQGRRRRMESTKSPSVELLGQQQPRLKVTPTAAADDAADVIEMLAC